MKEEEKKMKEEMKKKKKKRSKTMDIKKVVEEWEIWDEEEEVARLEKEAKKLVLEQFHRQIKVFEKKTSKRMPMRKVWDHAIKLKKGFVPRKGKVYPLSRKVREEVREFIQEQMRKEYIRLLKSPQTMLVFFVGKKDGKKGCYQEYWDQKDFYKDKLKVGL